MAYPSSESASAKADRQRQIHASSAGPGASAAYLGRRGGDHADLRGRAWFWRRWVDLRRPRAVLVVLVGALRLGPAAAQEPGPAKAGPAPTPAMAVPAPASAKAEPALALAKARPAAPPLPPLRSDACQPQALASGACRCAHQQCMDLCCPSGWACAHHSGPEAGPAKCLRPATSRGQPPAPPRAVVLARLSTLPTRLLLGRCGKSRYSLAFGYEVVEALAGPPLAGSIVVDVFCPSEGPVHYAIGALHRLTLAAGPTPNPKAARDPAAPPRFTATQVEQSP